MKTHELKVWIEFFCPLYHGRKTFEIRKNDRDFEVGDTLILKEYDPQASVYVGGEVIAEVTYVTDFMQAQGYVVLGIKIKKKRGHENEN